MNQEIQEQLDEQVEEQVQRQRVRVTTTSDAPLLSERLIREKGKKTFTVECIIDDEVFQIEVLRGVPLQLGVLLKKTADIFALQSAQLTAASDPGDPDAPVDGEMSEAQDLEALQALEAEELRIRRLMVSSLVVQTDSETGQTVPIFSCGGEPAGRIPIEEQSEKFLGILYDAVMEVQAPRGSVAALDRFSRVGRDDGSGSSDGA